MEAESTKPESNKSPLEVLAQSELLWQPYRAMARALLQTHQNISAYMDVNRTLAQEMQKIHQRANEMAARMSEKPFKGLSVESAAGSMEEMYDLALSSIRELGDAVVGAQVRSVELLREHARSAMAPKDSPPKA